MQNEQKKRTGVIAICSLIVVGCGLLFVRTYDFRVPTGPAATLYGPAFFPRALLALIVVASLVLLAQTALRSDTSGSSEKMAVGAKALVRGAAVWLLSLGFYLLWKEAGFLLPSMGFLLLTGVLLGERRALRLIALAAAAPLLTLVFERLLGVGLL